MSFDHASAIAGFEAVIVLVLAEVSVATGLTWKRTSKGRTMAEQHRLFEYPRDGIDNDNDGKIDEPDEKVTCADQGQSAHNFQLATDCCPMRKDGKGFWWTAPGGYWECFGAIAKSHGLVWGGDFKSIIDKPHIESANWRVAKTEWQAGRLHVA